MADIDDTTDDAVDTEDATPSMLDMSDDEVDNLDLSFLDGSPESEAEGSPLAEEETDETTAGDPGEGAADADLPGEGTDAADDVETATEEAGTEEEVTEPADDTEKTETSEEKDSVDYKAAYERLTAPFKANGKELQVKDVDEAIQLMQMGANYNKKMAGLKPNLKTMKMLENNGLLDEEKLNFLVDLDKKNPEAIAKLVKESGIDPLEMNVDEAKEYRPQSYTVDDRQLALDETLDNIQDSETYNQLIDVVSNKWDQSSKQTIADSPQVLNIINDHMANGIYDTISAEVERERTFGRLEGLSDIEAYRQVGDAIHARGGFNHLTQEVGDKPPESTDVTPPEKTSASPKVKEKKRAASPPKATSPSQAKQDYNPLAMSDEEFEKSVNQNLL